jgi:hypothetical protein
MQNSGAIDEQSEAPTAIPEITQNDQIAENAKLLRGRIHTSMAPTNYLSTFKAGSILA